MKGAGEEEPADGSDIGSADTGGGEFPGGEGGADTGGDAPEEPAAEPADLSDEPVEKIAWEMLPFLAIEVVVIFLITFVEAIPMTLPRLLGFA